MIRNHIYRTIVHHIFRVIYVFARLVYRVLKIFIGPSVHVHPRVHRFAIAIREAVKELIRPPEVTPNTIVEPSQDVSPQTIQEPIQEGEECHPHEEEKESRIPTWLIDEWREMHAIEPQLFPEKWLIENIPFYHIPTSRIVEPYLELCKLYGKSVSHVLLIPWIEKGGADIVTINYINTLVNYNLANGITVISTLNADSPWAEKLPEKVRFIEFGRIYSQLSEDEQEKLLTRLFLQMAPKVIHNINSELGYKIFVKYGQALSHISNLYVCSFCADITQEGKHVGYSFWYLAECFDYLKAVAVDNQTFLDR